MPEISPESGYLTVLNQFRTDSPDRMDRLVKEMKAIVDTAAFPGWISSTVHRGEQKLGTLNFIQWRGKEDLDSRYAGEEFRHHTVPIFHQITTAVRLMQTEVALSQRAPSAGDVTEISPDRDDYTVVEVIGVAPASQDEMITTVGSAHHEWLADTPGYRSQTVLRGFKANGPNPKDGSLMQLGVDNDFIVIYRQWASKEAYDGFRSINEGQQPAGRLATQACLDALTTSRYWNSYRVVHSRSATQPVAV